MSRERGATTVLMLAAAGLVLLLTVAVANAGLLISTRYRAAAAADAAALAAAPVTFRPFGATGSAAQEAARFAAMNGASVIACRCRSDRTWRARIVEVVVARRVRLIGGAIVTVQARSTAEFAPLHLVGAPVSPRD